MENTTLNPLDTSGVKKEKYIISSIIFFLVVAVAYLAWYVNRKPIVPPNQVPVFVPVVEQVVPSLETQASLGGSIYQQAQNPVKDKIPESVSPVVNPIEGAYKNPFE